VKIARVFPRRTSATPDDDLAFIGDPPLFLPDVDEVHISCAFTWDVNEANRLYRAWQAQGYKVRIGGPAFGSPAGEFTPGLYLKEGLTMTSRGCIRRCPFCFVPQREGTLRLLPIQPGWDIMDNNLLACPREHIEAVLDMLEAQPKPARFTGGIDSRLCQEWFAQRLGGMRVQILYTAFDQPAEQPYVERTVAMLRSAGLTQRQVGCYVLVGSAGDTLAAAEERLEWVFRTGGTPFAMYYRPAEDRRTRIPQDWSRFVRRWNRPALIFSTHADYLRGDLHPESAPALVEAGASESEVR
jgi:hypothetical protein